MTVKLYYSQGTGRAHLTMDRDGVVSVERLGVGYSGARPFVNKAEAEAVKAVGPIPRGNWRVRLLGDLVKFGPVVLSLEPLNGTNVFGRSGFLIHGDNAYGNRTASAGCIILPRKARDRIASLAPLELIVTD